MSKRMRPISSIVTRCVKETPDTWTLALQVKPEDRDYVAGQFITLLPHQFPELSEQVAYLEHHKGKKEPIRAYSMASAPFEEEVLITIKPERFHPTEGKYPPLLSPFLASPYMLGREVVFSGYTGAYVLPEHHEESLDLVVHFVSGSGVVPNYALLKDQLILNKNPSVKHVLINVNKTQEDIIYKNHLNQLAKEYEHRFEIHHFLTRETNLSDLNLYGHINMGRPPFEYVQNLIKTPQKTMIFACGAAITKWQRQIAEIDKTILAPRFMESVHEMVEKLGISRSHFKREVYG